MLVIFLECFILANKFGVTSLTVVFATLAVVFTTLEVKRVRAIVRTR
jgi:hypothetical protein